MINRKKLREKLSEAQTNGGWLLSFDRMCKASILYDDEIKLKKNIKKLILYSNMMSTNLDELISVLEEI